MSKNSSPLVRSYFVLVATITLFIMMFSAIQLLTIGLQQLIPSANRPEQGLENCEVQIPGVTEVITDNRSIITPSDEVAPTAEELKQACESRNAQALENWQHEQAADAVRDFAMIIVTLPLFLVHFKVVYRDMKVEREEK